MCGNNMSAPLPAIVPAARKATAAVSFPPSELMSEKLSLEGSCARKAIYFFVATDRNRTCVCS